MTKSANCASLPKLKYSQADKKRSAEHGFGLSVMWQFPDLLPVTGHIATAISVQQTLTEHALCFVDNTYN